MKLRPPYWKKGKTWKRPYRDSRRFSGSCRSHGGCSWCERQRRWFDIRARAWAKKDVEDWIKEPLDITER